LVFAAGIIWVLSALLVPDWSTRVAMSCAAITMFYGCHRLCKLSPGATTHAASRIGPR